MRELGRALIPAFVVAVLVGAAVFYVRSELTDKEYSASIVTEIKPAQTLIPGDAFIEQMRAPFIQLATDTDVLNQVVSQVDSDLDAGTLAGNLTTTPGTSPALLTFTVTASSPELALSLVQSMVSTVDQASNANYARDAQPQVEQAQAAVAAQEARIANLAGDDPGRASAEAELTQLREQLNQVQSAGGDQLVVLSSPEQSTAPVSPKPLSEALVAALAALIVAAELIVLLRGRFGSKPNRSWARRIARKTGAKFDTGAGGTLPPVLVARIDSMERRGAAPAGNARHAASRSESVVVVLVGDGASYERNSEDPNRRGAVVQMGLSEQWWRAVDVTDVDTVVVLVSRGGSDRRAAASALHRIGDFDIPTYLVLQPKNRNRPQPTQPPQAPTTSPSPNEQVETNAV